MMLDDLWKTVDTSDFTCCWGQCTFKLEKEKPLQVITHFRRHARHKQTRCSWGICRQRFKTPEMLREHYHSVHRLPIARTLGKTRHFCFECVEYLQDSSRWEDHCMEHLNNLELFCGERVARSIIMTALKCPFCLSSTELLPSKRWWQFRHRPQYRDHIMRHLRKTSRSGYPIVCPHPKCQSSIQGEKDFWNHLFLVHRVPQHKYLAHSEEAVNDETESCGQFNPNEDYIEERHENFDEFILDESCVHKDESMIAGRHFDEPTSELSNAENINGVVWVPGLQPSDTFRYIVASDGTVASMESRSILDQTVETLVSYSPGGIEAQSTMSTPQIVSPSGSGGSILRDWSKNSVDCSDQTNPALANDSARWIDDPNHADCFGFEEWPIENLTPSGRTNPPLVRKRSIRVADQSRTDHFGIEECSTGNVHPYDQIDSALAIDGQDSIEMQQTINEQQNANPSCYHQCRFGICRRSFATLSNVRNHERTHIIRNCQFKGCKEVFNSYRATILHGINVHRYSPWTCDLPSKLYPNLICGQLCRDKYMLKVHQQRHKQKVISESQIGRR